MLPRLGQDEAFLRTVEAILDMRNWLNMMKSH